MAAGMASNPVTYLLYKTATLLDNVAGGIALPDIKFMGTGVNLQTTVADLMRVASMSGGILSSLGSMIGSLGGGISGSGMLKALGITGYNKVARGGGYTPVASSGNSMSESGYLVGNSDSNAILDKTLGDAEEDKKSKMAEAKQDEENDIMNKDLNASIIKIFELLTDMTNGTKSISVRQEGSWVWSNTNG